MSLISPKRIFRLLAILFAVFAAGHSAKAQTKTNLGYVMSIGDSITEGYDATGNMGGWRTPLYTDLTGANYSFTFEGAHNTFSTATFNPPVGGSSDSGATLVAAGDSYNNGWSGATMVNEGNGSVNLAASIPSWFQNANLIPSYNSATGSAVLPKIITLEIGTNDILAGITSVTTLDADLNEDISEIFAADPTAYLIVAQITPLTGTYASYNQTVINFNKSIVGGSGTVGIVAADDALGEHVSTVDLYDSIPVPTNDTTSQAVSADQYDGIHPNIAGNAAIATDYLNAIEAIEPAPEPSTLALLIPATALLFYFRRHFLRSI